ncbi:hypothetical protein PHMEG_0008665 [Phytophthora megakarya]|uniref:M96 mating-specific protein n=1 Tax=Phytophthora megakarya TaxID=4795 RepID=A0A225WI55_9STRA|nr:hypothetical protein PHMEG_0008665 [Phytophthora megakarya]
MGHVGCSQAEIYTPETLSELLHFCDNIEAIPNVALFDVEAHQVFPRNSTNSLRPKSTRQRSKCVPYSTGLQRQRKAELDELREEERKLSDQLKFLLPVHGHTRREQVVAPNEIQHEQWRSQAMTKCEERIQAERQNRELKAIFIRHVKLFKSVRKVLADDDTIEGVEFVVQPRLAIDRPLFHIDTTEAILGELSSNLSRMYLETCMVMPPLSDNLSVAFRSLLSGNRDKIFETTSMTPLQCTVYEAGGVLWQDIAKVDNMSTKQSFNLNSVSLSYVSSLFVQTNDLDIPRYVVAITTHKQFENKDRVILVGSVRWMIPTECLEFEDQCWIVIEPSNVDTTYSSVVRTYYQLRTKTTGMNFTLQQKTIRDILMRSIAKMSRRFLQSVQNAFLELGVPTPISSRTEKLVKFPPDVSL